MGKFHCVKCNHAPLSKWERLRNMQKGVYSERYKCPKCGSLYKIPARITTLYGIFFLSLLLLAFYRIVLFPINMGVFLLSYPLYLLNSPLSFFTNSSR